MNDAIIIIVSLALLAFLWGVLKYFFYSTSPEKRKESSKFITYGLLSLLVITSVWGFVNILAKTLLGKNSNSNSKVEEYIGDDPTSSNVNKGIFDDIGEGIVS